MFNNPTHSLSLSLSLSHTHTHTHTHSKVALERLALLGPVNCPSFIEVKGTLHCSVEDVLSVLESSDSDKATPVYEFDHTHPHSVDSAPTVVLYAELGKEGISPLHIAMATLAREGRVRYVLRHYQSVRVKKNDYFITFAFFNALFYHRSEVMILTC